MECVFHTNKIKNPPKRDGNIEKKFIYCLVIWGEIYQPLNSPILVFDYHFCNKKLYL